MSGQHYEMRDIWVDGRVYRVPTPVLSHVRWLESQNSRFAERLTDLVEELKRLRLEVRGEAA